MRALSRYAMRLRQVALVIAFILSLAGCAQPTNPPVPPTQVAIMNTATPPATLAPVATATPVPTDTATPVPTPTGTPTRTATPTATRTATATATQTKVPTRPVTAAPTLPPEPTAVPTAQAGGHYAQSSCTTYFIAREGLGEMRWCAAWVQLYPDKLEFGMTWEVTVWDPWTSQWYSKRSDHRNRDMYLIDELGQRYDHFEEVTGAAGTMTMLPHVVYEGIFYFPLPTNGARRFDFYQLTDLRGGGRRYVVVTAVLP